MGTIFSQCPDSPSINDSGDNEQLSNDEILFREMQERVSTTTYSWNMFAGLKRKSFRCHNSDITRELE